MTRLVPPGATVAHVDLDGGRVRVLHAGDSSAPPVILAHGGSTDNAAISWYRLFEPLSETHRVIAPDLPGFGATTGIEPGGPQEQADFLLRLSERMEVGRATVCGVSMGGEAALNLALRHPESVRALVLVAPGGLVPRIGNRVAHTATWLVTRLPEQLLVPVASLGDRFVDIALKAVTNDVSTLPAPVVEEIGREARRPRSSLGYLRYHRAAIGRTGMRNHLMPHIRGVQAPTLLFRGENDSLMPLRGSREAAARMPDARLVTVPDCGHWAQLDAHERFLREVTSFLGEGHP
ncbi:alpha/beta fold hydrolase [Halostreptopolyspora alba]|uniref:Alpha/beta fold hydrolase n=1 Tax=Halostreptopolyspora alba TaxID=2487137 RepID=A0A3N0EGZ1_9ACTN|nr:alpha/beta fold hydrolase [Nocardiopsaceae bacterium YIM 96095]